MVRETRHLWVGNLPDSLREDRIREHFKRYGRVQSVKLLPRGGKEEACEMACTVAFMDIKSASKAHTAEHKLDDRTLTTEYYEPAAIPSSSSPPNASTGYATTSPSNTRFPNGHSTAEEHGNFTERFYDRTNNTRVPESEYIRRTGYHEANRARTRDRNFRNGPYNNSLVERHRTVNNSWTFDGTTNRYNNQTNDTGYNTTSTDISDRRSEQSTKKKTKSRSGSRTPSPSGSASSRSPSRSRSRSSSSSTSSSVSRETSSSTGSPKSRRLQSNNSSHQPVVHSEDRRPLAICVRNLPLRSSDTSLKDGLFHEYKKHGKVTWVKVVGQSADRHAIVCFKKPEDVEKALEVSYDKLFFGCKIEVAPYQGFDVEDVDLRPYEAEIDEFHPKATRTLFIGNLEKDVTASDLRKHFDQFGEIIEIDIKKQGAVSSYAFCQYSDIVSVVKAIRTMDGEHLNNNRIKLGFGKSMPTPCVWVDGVSDSVTDKYLSIQFDPFGIVGPTFIDREKGQALIFFDQVINAQTAVNKMRGVNLRGRKIQVDFASRECQEAFFENLEKQGLSFERPGFEERRDSTTRNFETLSASRFSRYDTPTRPRTASYSSRTGAPASQVVTTAIPSPGTPGSVTPRGAGSRSRLARFEYYDPSTTLVDFAERSLRSYDEYSQGSGASQEDVYDHEYVYHESPSHLEVLESRLQAGDHVILPFAQPDIKNLQKERVLLLEQLEECHSSGDELIGPKKRFKLDHLDGTVASDVIIEANRDHRKVMEVRRSSDASLKHLSRRPSIDGKHVGHERGSYLPHAVCKRRKTAGSDSGKVHHYESSESVSGSRPGTPLCDERPENFAPSEPRRVPREREGPLTLPLPRFASQLMGRASVSVAGIKGQKENILASPPAAVTSPRISNPKPPSPTPVPPPASPPPRPPSLSSNSSDSDGASPSPSLDERIKSLDEKYEKWSGSRALSTAGIDALAKLDMTRERFKFRHKLLDLDLKEVQPSEIVKSVMAKRSVFDEDSKRLENVGEKYEPKDFNLYPRTPVVTVQTTVPATTLSTLPLLKVCTNLLPKTPTMLSPRSSGTSLTPAKGLQYPFPTHPPMQPSPSSSTTTCTTPTPPSQPPTSTTPRSTHGENRLKSCANASSDNWTPSKVNVNRSVSSSVVTNKPSDANKNIPPPTECASPALQSDTKPKTIKNATRRDSTSSSETKSRRNSETGRRPDESEICDNTETDRLEKARLENEKIEKESVDREKAEKEKQERERAERERLEKEREEKERQDKLEKERLEKERLEKERKERERKEREDKEKREREEKEQREREQHEREQREEKERRERDERERREKEDKERREREDREKQERERREREEKERRERGEREKREKEEQLERERVEKERLERERRERRDREEKERKEREERERRDKDDLEKEKKREKEDERKREKEEERKHKDDNHDKRSEYRHRDNHSENKTDIKNAKEDKNSDKRDNHISRKENRYEADKRKENNLQDKTKISLFNEIRETKDRPAIENHHIAVDVERKLDIKDIARKKERSNSISGPVGIKRRLSSHESLDSSEDNAKKIKFSQEHKKISERRDSKDSNKSKHKNSTSCKSQDDTKSRHNHVNDEKRREKDREERHKNKHKLDKQKLKSKNRERDSNSAPKSPPKDMDKEFLARLDLVEVEKQRQRSKELKEVDFKRLEERKREILLKDKNDDSNKSGDEQRKQKRERIKKFSNSSENSDSDEPKKHSIFDIVDDEPAYISMYDKVKARSCKNMQKQEEEKRQEKIKAKFSQLKQSRAKREDKKRSTSWDEDSDSDERGEKSERHRKNKMLIISSDEDDDESMSHRVKKEILTDSDSDRNRTLIKSETIESSDEDHVKTMRKFKSRITSDSSDDEFRKIQNRIKTEMFSDNDDQGFADCEEKYKKLNVNDFEDKYINKKERKNNKSDLTQQIFGDSNSPDIKEDKFVTNRRYDNSSADESTKIEVRKKHKKKQKRQKNSLSSEESSKFESDSLQNDSEKNKSEKKKQHSKKDKKRDKSRDEKQKKSKKTKSETKDLFRRDGKMENIFGSFSDDSESHRDENNEIKNTFLNRFNSEENNSMHYASDSDSPMQDKKICEENLRRKSEEKERAKAEEKERIMKEEHRKRKEKKRREKEKRLREEQMNNDHSVDYSDLGKQLEDNIKDLTNDIQEGKIKTADVEKMQDLDETFKFNEIEEFKKDTDRKELKEKKKKRKKSKDEKQRHHHHHHHHDKNKIKSPETKKEEEIKMELFDGVEKSDKEAPNLDLSLSPQTREPMISPIPKTPTSSKEKKRDKFIPGFGAEIDEKVHDNAVKSISEFEAPKIEIQANHVEEEKIKEEKTEVLEEKPRVIISQEETEDAVAALLGESFGSGQFSDCYNEPQSPEQTNVSEENVQDDEEMRKAVQSLNSGELEIKPDTPQSENDLQIDTDTEEQEDVGVKYEPPRTPEMIDFSQPPKTPDIPSYFRKESQDRSMPSIGSPPSLTPIKPQIITDAKRTLDLDVKKIEINTRTVITQWSEKKDPPINLDRIPSLAIQPSIAAKLALPSVIKTEENLDNLPPLKPVNKPTVKISMHNMPAQMPYPVLSQKEPPHLPKIPTTNLSTINRLPITPVMVSKPITPTTLLLPQAKVAHARLELQKDTPSRMIYQQYPGYSQPRMIVQRPPGLIMTNRPPTPTSAYLQPTYNIDSNKLKGSFSTTEPPKLVSMPQPVQPVQTPQTPSIIISTHCTATTASAIKPFKPVIQEAPKLVSLSHSIPQPSIIQSIPKPTIAATAITTPSTISSTNTIRSSFSPATTSAIVTASMNVPKSATVLMANSVLSPTNIFTTTNVLSSPKVLTPTNVLSGPKILAPTSFLTSTNIVTPTKVSTSICSTTTNLTPTNVLTSINASMSTNVSASANVIIPSKVITSANVTVPTNVLTPMYVPTCKSYPISKNVPTSINIPVSINVPPSTNVITSTNVVMSSNAITSTNIITQTSNVVTHSQPPSLITTKPVISKEMDILPKVVDVVKKSTPSPVIVSTPKIEEPEISIKSAEPLAIEKVTDELNFSLKKLEEDNKAESPLIIPAIKIDNSAVPVKNIIDAPKLEEPIEPKIEVQLKPKIEVSNKTKQEMPNKTKIEVPIKTKIELSIKTKIEVPINTKIEAPLKTKIEIPVETNIEQIKEEGKIPEANKPQIKPELETVSVIKETEKFDEEKADTESVISDISKEPLSNDVKEDGIDSKEDSDYWSAKEVNIDSVIKKVDALCSADELSDRSSEVGKDDWLEDKSTKVDQKEERKLELIEAPEGVTIVEEKPVNTRGRKAGRSRGRKTRGGAVTGGMQTRRTKIANEVPAVRGSRGGGRVGRPKNDRNISKSESEDVYEFKDDSDECQNKDRPRLILTIKSPSVTGANGNTASVKEVTKELPPPSLTVVQTSVPTQIIQPSQTPPKIEKVDNKEEFASPANTRKSRRLQERDVSRNTIDDTIEDVVKNTILTRAAAAAQAARRVTRQTPTKELNRKSPRGINSKKKDRRASETTDDSSEEKFVKSDIITKPENVEVPNTKKEVPSEAKIEIKEKPIEGLKAAVLRRVKGDMIHEPMTLIDPVTGLLTPMRECEEGRYIPLPSQNANLACMPRMVVSKAKSQEITHTAGVITPQIPAINKQKPQSLKAHVLAKASQQVATSTVASPVTTTFVPKTLTQSINVNVSLPNYTPAHLSPKLPTGVGVARPMQGVKVIQPPLSPNVHTSHQQVIIQQTKGVPKTLIGTQVTNSNLGPQMAHMKQGVQTSQLNKVPLMKPHIITQQIVPGNLMKQHILTANNPPMMSKNMEPPKVEVSIASGCVMVPRSNASSQSQQRHVLQPGLPVAAYETTLHGERRRSPPPAHQNSPSPQAEGIAHFSPGAVPLRPPHDIAAHYVHPSHVLYQQYFRQQSYHLPRSPIIGLEKSSDGQEGEEAPVTSPPLELCRPGSVGLALTARPNVVPHSLQSPHDRVTSSPQLGQVFSARCRRQPYNQGRYYESNEPPPAHRPLTSHSSLAALGSDRVMSHITTLGTPDRPLSSHSALGVHIGSLGTPERPLSTHIPDRPLSTHLPDRPMSTHLPDRGMASLGLSAVLGAAGNIMGAVARHVGPDAPALQRSLQAATPPHASQVPPQAESLLMLLKQYPLMWQGLLALKNDQAAVQMYFVSGNDSVAKMSLPKNTDGTTPPLRIFQRMRLEPPQVEGVARKMQMENEHCMLLALPCGHDHIDVLKQSTNLENGFITYLQQKHAAGIVNVAAPGTTQPPAYVVHIFPTCDFVNENLRRIAPSLLERVADISHLLIVITTV